MPSWKLLRHPDQTIVENFPLFSKENLPGLSGHIQIYPKWTIPFVRQRFSTEFIHSVNFINLSFRI